MMKTNRQTRTAATRPIERRSVCAGGMLMLAALLTTTAGRPAEQDICQNKQGPELIRCIEDAARAKPASPTPTRPGKPDSAARPPAPAVAPTPIERAPTARVAPSAPAEDCTGRTGEPLRRCLAAGGRLAPHAAVVAPGGGTVTPPESCDGKSGEALRICVEAAAKAPQAAIAPAQPQIIACTGYTTADQPLCVHRNSALAECRKRQQYPDFDVCLRSFMVRAPQPVRLDCSTLQARSRAHCEARNEVFQSCLPDKLGYFTCLEQKLGPQVRLTRQ